MDFRRLLNVAYAHLTRDLTADGRREIDRQLAEKFDGEMTDEERRRSAYWRKAAELGINAESERQLMGALDAAKPA